MLFDTKLMTVDLIMSKLHALFLKIVNRHYVELHKQKIDLAKKHKAALNARKAAIANAQLAN